MAPWAAMHDVLHGRRLEALAVFATVARNPAIARVEAAFLLFGMMEVATWIAILVYAYDWGGVSASGIVAFIQLVPAALVAPAAAALGERLPRTRMLAIAYLVLGLVTLVTAGCLLTGLPQLVVFAVAVVSGSAITLVRPAHAAVLPSIARMPSELTAANVVSGTVETIGTLVGAIGGGAVLAAFGPGAVYLVGGLAMVGASAAVVRMPGVAAPPVQRRRSAAHPPVHQGAAAGSPAPGVAAAARNRMRSDLAAGFRSVRADPHVRALLTLVALGSTLIGVLDVLCVVLALDVLHIGDQGVGLLSGAFAFGGLVGSAGAIALVGRLRISGPLIVAGLAFGLGVVVAGASPVAGVAIACLVAAGMGRSVHDVAGRTLLQRVADPELLARIFGVVEGVNMGALAVGTIAAPILVHLLGPAGAFAVAGLSIPVGIVLLRGPLSAADDAGVRFEAELALLRRVPIFAPLRAPELERLASHLEPVAAAAGTTVIREGDPGDRFYVIAAGRCEVTVGGRVIRSMGAGEAFGEIALLGDVPRTATVTAIDDAELFALERDPFIEAVTGRPQARVAAARVVSDRLAATS